MGNLSVPACGGCFRLNAKFAKRFRDVRTSVLSIPIAWIPLTVLLLISGVTALAQTTADSEKRLADIEKAVKSAQMAGDNAWMLTSAALVLMMTGPGLALFY